MAVGFGVRRVGESLQRGYLVKNGIDDNRRVGAQMVAARRSRYRGHPDGARRSDNLQWPRPAGRDEPYTRSIICCAACWSIYWMLSC